MQYQKALSFAWLMAAVGALGNGLKWLYDAHVSAKGYLSGSPTLNPCPNWARMMGIGFILVSIVLFLSCAR